MRITRIEGFYRDNENARKAWQRKFWQFGVEVHTDAGLTGLGVGGAGMAGLEVVRHALAPALVGRDSCEVEARWDEMYRATLPFGRRGVALMAMSAIDLALWDLVGKVRGQPVWRCLNDRAPARIRSYATTPHVEACRDLGFQAFKLPVSEGPADGEAGLERLERKVAAARASAGADVPLMIDCWMGWDLGHASRAIERLAPYRLAWIEEPLPPDDLAEYRELGARARAAGTRLAAGEHEYGWAGFRDLLESDAVAVLQPDVTWCGGLTPALKVWRAAEAGGKVMAPHRGGEVWGLHLNFAFGGQWAECVCLDGHSEDDPLVEGAPVCCDGFFAPPEAPGFGVRWRKGVWG